MDIIECLIKLGSGIVNSMLDTSKRYSKDERFTPEGREYYKELYEGLSIASKNLQDYQKRKSSSTFEKLHTNVNESSKLNSKKSNKNILKIYALIESYFGIYRGKYPFYFFDQNDSLDLKEQILQYLRFPYGEGKFEFHLTPILAFSSKKKKSNSEVCCLNTMVFCEEGIAFDYSNEFKVIAYEDIIKVYKKEHKKFFVTLGYDIFLSNTSEELSTHYVLESKYPPAIDLFDFNEKESGLIAYAVYDFIRCFNHECKYIER